MERGEKVPVDINDSIERLIILEGIAYSIWEKKTATREILLERAEEEASQNL